MSKPYHFNWVPVLAGRMTLTHRPPRQGGLAQLQATGCTRVVTLLYEAEGALLIGAQAQALGLAWFWLPLRNGQYPTGEAHLLLLAALPVLAGFFTAGDSMMIHCSAGLHRTGMVAYSVLRWCGYDDEQALTMIEQMRPLTRAEVGDKRLAWGRKYAVHE